MQTVANFSPKGQKPTKKGRRDIPRRPWTICMEATPRFELGVKALQASALPLGDVAIQ